MSERTQGPWVIYDDSNNLRVMIKGIHPVHGNFHVADVLGRENAAAIVLWENNFDALVKALDESRLQIEYMQSKFEPTGSGNAVLASIRSVLAKVKP